MTDLSPDQQTTLTRILKGQALRDVYKVRCEQVTHKQHSDEKDLEHALGFLPREARSRIDAALENLPAKGEPDPERARQYLVIAGAIIFAAIDRIDLMPAVQTELFEGEE